jgi:hypothetical protein
MGATERREVRLPLRAQLAELLPGTLLFMGYPERGATYRPADAVGRCVAARVEGAGVLATLDCEPGAAELVGSDEYGVGLDAAVRGPAPGPGEVVFKHVHRVNALVVTRRDQEPTYKNMGVDEPYRPLGERG